MDPAQAQESLDLIQEADRATRRSMARAGIGYLFIIWGIVWLFGHLGSELLGPASGYLWLGLDLFGVGASAFAILRYSRRVRFEGAWRIGAFWVLLVVYCALLMWIVWPLEGERYVLFVTAFVTMGYTLFGLWASPPLAVIGLAISVLAVIGWKLLPAHLGYWLAFTGGGGLILAGLVVMRAWK